MSQEFLAPSLQVARTALDIKIVDNTEIAFCSSENARSLVPLKLAEKLQVLPLHLRQGPAGEELSFAVVAYDDELKKSLEFELGRKVELLVCENQNIAKAIFKAYKKNDKQLSDLKIQLQSIVRPLQASAEKNLWESGQTTELKFLSALVEYAIACDASDIHLIPGIHGTILKLRINGTLSEHPETIGNSTLHAVFINRLKVLAQLDISQKNLPQDGGLAINAAGRKIHLRVSTMPTIAGEKAVVRIQGNREIVGLEKLGINTKCEKFIRQSLKADEGLILFCGPTGSGKTTTIYSALNELALDALSIVTIEDPVEISFPRAEQTDLSLIKNLTYEKALRSVMRQDPDIIVIGEIRESASAELAFNAALTGHLVLSTVHAGSVTGALRRLKRLGIEESLIAASLRLIVNQRLVPSLCARCRTLDLENSQTLGGEIYKPVGCEHCQGSGYSGQVPATEVLLTDENIIDKFYSTGKLLKRQSSYLGIKKNLQELLFKGKIDYAGYRLYLE